MCSRQKEGGFFGHSGIILSKTRTADPFLSFKWNIRTTRLKIFLIDRHSCLTCSVLKNEY